METKIKISIPVKNEVIRNHIFQTVNDFPVLQLHWFHPKNTENAELFILTKNCRDTEAIRNKTWLRKAAEEHEVHVHVSSYQKAAFQLRLGNPFYQYYANPSAIIWKGEEVTEPMKIYETKKSFKKHLNVFKEKFYHDHDILLSEAKKFRSGNMFSAAFRTYLTIFEHDFEYLECMYTGWISFDKDIHTRLRHLILRIPELQKLFLMKNKNCFYVIDKMEKSVKAAGDGDDCFDGSELYDAVQSAEEQMSKMVADRFYQFNKMISFKNASHHIAPVIETVNKKDEKLDRAVATIVERLAPEEIYLFQRKESYSQNGEVQKRLLYFLVVGEGMSDASVFDTRQSVCDSSGGRVNVLMLAHRRFNIQEALFESQDFMKDLMTPENRVYASHPYHPAVHWEYSSADYYGDLYIYHHSMTDTVQQYFKIRENADEDNNAASLLLFSHAVMKVLRVYLYCTLCSYVPNLKKMDEIWNLCLYANPSLEKVEYLFDKFSSDFFKLTDSFLKYTDRSYSLTEDEVAAMDEILTILTAKLEKQIKDRNLTEQLQLNLSESVKKN